MLRILGLMLITVLATACGGPDLGKLCEEMYACTTELSGESIGIGEDSFVDVCEDAFDREIESYEDDEVDALSDAIDACDSKKSCNFLACVETKGGNLSDLGGVGGSQSECGDDFADADEACDGSDLWGEDCQSVTAGTRPGGSLSCNADCTFDTSGCM